MAVAFRSATTFGSASTSAPTIAKPAGTAVGDELLFCIMWDNTAADITLSGDMVTAVLVTYPQYAGSHDLLVMRLRATGSEPATFTGFAFTAATGVLISCLAFSGCPSPPIDTTKETQAQISDSFNMLITGTTPSNNDVYAVRIAAANAGGAVAGPTTDITVTTGQALTLLSNINSTAINAALRIESDGIYAVPSTANVSVRYETAAPGYVWNVIGLTIYLKPGAPPTVTAISPAFGPISGGEAVQITGTGFTGATSVTIDGVACTGLSVVSDTIIACVTPAGSIGAKTVAVTTPGGTGSF